MVLWFSFLRPNPSGIVHFTAPSAGTGDNIRAHNGPIVENQDVHPGRSRLIDAVNRDVSNQWNR